PPYPFPIPSPTILLSTYPDLDPWYDTLLSTARLLNLVPLFLDPPPFFTGHTQVMTSSDKTLNEQREFVGDVPGCEGKTYSLTILTRPEHPVIWEHFPDLFLHRLTPREQRSVMEGVMEGVEGAESWSDGVDGYGIVWRGPSREKERELGWERLGEGERRVWERVVAGYKREMEGYERQVWGLGMMRAWLGGAIDRGLLKKVMDPDRGVVFEVKSRGGRRGRRDDDVGGWGEAGGLRKMVMGCVRVLLVEEHERVKAEKERKEEEERKQEQERKNEEERRKDIRKGKRKAVD
ncbi:hypothetical protein QBC41DRAFT_205116, partial [Cercophora samala]